jgi:hypothetical protein
MACVLTTVPAAAQDPDARHVSVGAAAGVAMPFHGDFDFNAGSWQADVRVDTMRHFGFSVFFEQWRHTDEEVLADQTITGPSSVLGRADRIVLATEHRTRVAGWSFLGDGTVGRVTLNGGGGISYLRYSRDVSQTMSGCSPATLCQDSSRQFDNGSFAAQLQSGVDVAIVRHVAAMGQFRMIVPIDDPGGGHSTVMGGLRFVF